MNPDTITAPVQTVEKGLSASRSDWLVIEGPLTVLSEWLPALDYYALEVAVDPGRFRRNFYTTSSCGVCGKLAMGAVEVRPSRTMRKSGPQFRADLIRLLPDLPGRKMCNWTTAVMECDRQIFYFPDLGPT